MSKRKNHPSTSAQIHVGLARVCPGDPAHFHFETRDKWSWRYVYSAKGVRLCACVSRGVGLTVCICAHGCVLVFSQDFATGSNANKVRSHKNVHPSEWVTVLEQEHHSDFLAAVTLALPGMRMCQASESVINNYFKILHNIPTLKRPRPSRSAASTVSAISCSSLTSRVEYKWFCGKKKMHAKEPAANALQPQKTAQWDGNVTRGNSDT